MSNLSPNQDWTTAGKSIRLSPASSPLQELAGLSSRNVNIASRCFVASMELKSVSTRFHEVYQHEVSLHQLLADVFLYDIL